MIVELWARNRDMGDEDENDAENSIHRIHHTPKIVCLPFILIITSWPLNQASVSGVPLHESSKLMSRCHIPTVAS